VLEPLAISKKCVSHCSPLPQPSSPSPGPTHSTVTAALSVCACVCVCVCGNIFPPSYCSGRKHTNMWAASEV